LAFLRACGLPFLAKALTTEYGAILRGAERDRRLLAALRADGRCLDAGMSLALRRTYSRKPLRFARFAAFGFVTKLLVVKEKLFARGEHKVSTAIHAL